MWELWGTHSGKKTEAEKVKWTHPSCIACRRTLRVFVEYDNCRYSNDHTYKKKQGQVDPSAHVSPYQWDADRFWNFKGNSEPRFRARRGSRLLHPFCSGCGNGNTGKWNHMPRNNVVISSSVKTQIHMPWVFDLVHCFLVYAVSWLAELVANQSFWRTSIYQRKGLITTFVCTPLTHLPPKEDYIVSFICSENICWSFPVLGAQ